MAKKKSPVQNHEVVKIYLKKKRKNSKIESYCAETEDGRTIYLRRVSEILSIIDKPGLRYWAAGEAVEYIKSRMNDGEGYTKKRLERTFDISKFSHDATLLQAQRIGSEVHEIIEFYLLSVIEFPEDPSRHVWPESGDWDWFCEEKKRALLNFQEEWVELEFTPLMVEVKVWDVDSRSAGTFDLIAQDKDGKIVLVDFKTSKAVVESHILQLSWYSMMVKKCKGIEIDYALVFRVPKLQPCAHTMVIPGELLKKAAVIFEQMSDLDLGLKDIRKTVKKEMDEWKDLLEGREEDWL